MTSLRRAIIGSAVGLGVVASLFAAPASASTERGVGPSSSAGTQASDLSAAAKSRYQAGYRATDAGHVSAVIIKAVDVPEVSCSGPDFQGVALGGGSEPASGHVEYFAGIHLTCASGQAQYLMEVVVNGKEQATGIEPGDQAQIVITLQCDAYPTCDVFADATSLDTDTSVSVETTMDVTTDSAVFGAFPLFSEGTERPAPVPVFGKARIRGCLFGDHLLGSDAQRLTRVRQGVVEIRATRISVGSFKVKPAGPGQWEGQ